MKATPVTSSSSLLEDGTRIKIGLKIHLFSFSLPKNLIKDTDNIRVSITSIPEKAKQYFYFQGKEMNSIDHIFDLNITNKTEEVIIVFRRKDFLENDPILASTIIHRSDFPLIPQNINDLSSDKKITPIRTIKILEPNHKHNQEQNKQRKTIGKMKAQLSLTVPFPEESDNKKTNNIFQLIKNDEELIEPKYNSYTEYMLF